MTQERMKELRQRGIRQHPLKMPPRLAHGYLELSARIIWLLLILNIWLQNTVMRLATKLILDRKYYSIKRGVMSLSLLP